MADNSEKFVLAFDVEMQMKKAAKQVDTFSKQLQKLTKEPAKFRAAEKKAFSAFAKETIASTKNIQKIKKSLEIAGKEVLTGGLLGIKARKQFKQLEGDFFRIEQASANLKDTLNSHRKEVFDAERKLRKASTEEERKAAKEQLKTAQELAKAEINKARAVYKEKKDAINKALKDAGVEKTLKGAGKKVAGSQKEAGVVDAARKKSGKEIYESFKDGAREVSDAAMELKDALMSKDALGLIKGAGNFAGKAIQKSFEAGAFLARRTLSKAGGKVSDKGSALIDAGKKKGGLAGFGMKAGGGAMKALGGVMKALGPLLGMLSKMGPLLSASAAIFAGMVKIFIDADAQAKQFNKDILESASSVETLYANGGDAGKAFKSLDKTLDNLRSDAFDLSNLSFGMRAEDFKAVTNALTQEGVTLQSITQQFKNASNAEDQFGDRIQDFTDLTKMAITYSRMFGVSLAEVGTFSAEISSEMGLSFSEIQLSYAKMAKDAAESGIAANKFFAIIRNVSSDLALYNTRLGQAATILKLLGKAMNPRDAAKFMQTLAKGQKDMSEEDRLHQTIIVGEGKQREIVEKDLKRKQALMYADMAKTGVASLEEIQAAAAKGGDELDKIVNKMAANQQGAFHSAISEMKMDKNALEKGGVFGVSEAAANLSAAGAFTSKKAALQKFGGNKKLSEMTGVQAFAARKVTGTSMEEFRAMAKMEAAIEDQKKTMQQAMDEVANGGGDKAQKETVERLKALGITDKKALAAADDADIIAAMEKSDQDALAASQEQENYAQETAKATVSIGEKLEQIIDGIFEFIYEALKGIISDIDEFIDLVAQLPGLSKAKDPAKEARDYARKFTTKDNAKTMRVLKGSLQEGGGGSESFASQTQEALEKGMKESLKEQTLAYAKMVAKNEGKDFDTLSADDKAAYMKKGEEQIKIHRDAKSTRGSIGDKAYRSFTNLTGLLDEAKSTNNMGGANAAAIASKAGIKGDQLQKFIDTVRDEKDFNSAMLKGTREAGLDPDQIMKMMSLMTKELDPESLAKYAADSPVLEAGLAAHKNRPEKAADAAAPTPTGQTAAAQKAAAPGTGGAPAAAPATAPTTAVAAPAAPGAGPAGSPAPGAPGTPGAAAVAGPPPASKVDEKQLSLTSDLVDQNNDITKLLGQSGTGIKMNKSFLQSPYQRAVEEAVTDATRKTLAEFALYTAKDPQAVLDKMKASGFDQVQSFAEGFEKDKRYKDGFLRPGTEEAHASGGMIMGLQSDGRSIVKPAPGEQLVSAMKGEMIVNPKRLPAHATGGVVGGGSVPTGGGGNVVVNVNGLGGADLANFLRDRVTQLIYEYKKREKFT